MIQNALTHFESLAQRLVEGSFGRLFGQNLELLDIASHIARAMGDSVSDGVPASTFHVTLSTKEYESGGAANQRS